ncbi:MAG: hypothetical protein HKN33_14300 [Pyrinomonadaceae bacterium]|nr:hypothetical protein [Pyrinomonadaceae bacterium]
MVLRLVVICLVFGAFAGLTGCGSPEKATPEMSKSLLKMRGYKFTKDEFFRAIKGGDSAIINGFMDGGMDPNTKDKDGFTALTFALMNTELKSVRVIARRANINLQDEQGNGPFHLAVSQQNEGAVNFFLKAKADVNVTGKDGRVTNQSPLYAALLNADLDMMKRLVKLGADPNIADSDGAFPLSEACVRNRTTLEFVKLLVENGAEVNKVEKNGASPLTYAAQNTGIDAETRKSIVEYLLEKGADKSLKDKTGKTALDWAKESGNKESVELLK